MSIDAKEWADTFLKQHCRNIGEDASTRFSSAVQFHVDLCRAVIADELPNIAKAVMNTPLDKMGDLIECETFAEAKAPQPEAAGDVPEDEFGMTHEQWFGKTIDAWPKIEAEISRRVAEAVADKDKRIAELDRILGDCNAAFKESDSDRRHAIGYLTRLFAVYAPQCAPFSDLSGLISQIDNYICGLKMDAEELKQQLAAAQAEVARLRADVTDETATLKDANTKLRSEVSRLTRPVEGVDWKAMWKKYFETPGFAHECLRRIVEPILQAERNAREAAETERDELREFVRTKSVWSSCFGPTVSFRLDNRGHNIPDAELDRLLAEFRAEKGKVGA